jgi:hypothetical protein
MQGHITTAVLGGFILFMALGVPVWVRAEADEAQLDGVSKDIDRTIAPGKKNQVQTLASQFNVAPGVVEDLSAKMQGWGEATIALAMAQRLAQMDAETYPSMVNAFNRIATLRSQKMGWRKIARSLGFELGPVVSVARHARNELRYNSSMARVLSTRNSGKAVKAERTAMVERIERPEPADHPNQPAQIR